MRVYNQERQLHARDKTRVPYLDPDVVENLEAPLGQTVGDVSQSVNLVTQNSKSYNVQRLGRKNTSNSQLTLQFISRM